MEKASFDVRKYRAKFPAIQKENSPIFFDAVGGTQVPDSVISAVTDYFINKNGNKGGVFPESRATDEVMDRTRILTAAFINAPSSDEIIFGPNFTTNTFAMSRALAKTWNTGDNIVVSRLDHDANVSPWVRAAEDSGVEVRYMDITSDGNIQLDIEDYGKQLDTRTRIVAFCAASSSVGTRTDVKKITEMAHSIGALSYVDAVAYAPHGPIDVQEWGADFVGISTYKFFGPHVGLLWAREELLRDLPAYKIRPAPDELPGKWLNGAQSYETLAGVNAAFEYLQSVGQDHPEYNLLFPNLSRSRQQMKAGMQAIRDYETTLTRKLLNDIKALPQYTVWGTQSEELDLWRVPTIAVSRDEEKSNDIALYLADNRVNIWSRSVYSVSLSERLGLENTGGFIRVGFVHYNTPEEIDRLLQLLDGYKKFD